MPLDIVDNDMHNGRATMRINAKDGRMARIIVGTDIRYKKIYRAGLHRHSSPFDSVNVLMTDVKVARGRLNHRSRMRNDATEHEDRGH